MANDKKIFDIILPDDWAPNISAYIMNSAKDASQRLLDEYFQAIEELERKAKEEAEKWELALWFKEEVAVKWEENAAKDSYVIKTKPNKTEDTASDIIGDSLLSTLLPVSPVENLSGIVPDIGEDLVGNGVSLPMPQQSDLMLINNDIEGGGVFAPVVEYNEDNGAIRMTYPPDFFAGMSAEEIAEYREEAVERIVSGMGVLSTENPDMKFNLKEEISAAGSWQITFGVARGAEEGAGISRVLSPEEVRASSPEEVRALSQEEVTKLYNEVLVAAKVESDIKGLFPDTYVDVGKKIDPGTVDGTYVGLPNDSPQLDEFRENGKEDDGGVGGFINF